MKKALIVTSTAGFAKGFLLHDMQLLQQMGYEVHCAANASNTVTFNAAEWFAERNVQFHQIDFSARTPICKDNYIAAIQYWSLMRKLNFNVIHCHTPVVGAIVRIMTLLTGLRKKCKVIYTTHGLAFHEGCGLKNKILYGGIEYICAFFCDAVVTINREDYTAMRKSGCRKVFRINGVGVDVKKFRDVDISRNDYRKSIGVDENEILILAVGELSERKNHQIVIKALSQLREKNFVFVICGKAMEEKGTYDLLVNLGKDLNVNVKFLGFRKDVPQITNCADIAVLPSLREGLGLAGIEALASGVPVVGATVQGIKDYVVDGETGYLCDPRDATQFARRIEDLTDPAVRHRMKGYCIKKAEEFSIDVSHRQMEEIYKQVLMS